MVPPQPTAYTSLGPRPWMDCSGYEVPLSIVPTVQRAITIQGSYVGNPQELRDVVELARTGKLKPMPIERRAAERISESLDQLKAGTLIGRVVAEMGA